MEQTHIKVDIVEGPQVESQLYENSNNAGYMENKPQPVHVFEIDADGVTFLTWPAGEKPRSDV